MDLTQLRAVVAAHGVTATAKRAGLHRVTVSRWLNDRRPLTLEQLEAVAGAVGWEIVARPVKRRRKTPATPASTEQPTQ